ncbi:uncharacterized protein MAM_08293 [Metarhizium album ARSEF 1941]|uniref:Uncharacterized protein n=1 Tax=Metarhizium album (strain ARSEF 1941) TaxID=1081103 RepID=A0A0B2WDE7_METAS|nr:uncharacterized protein MAM_08293 [Metarhizium album ARSEF 1941]KHN93871.1 hypothetical protein MAM_08293 [Metarhizium album ARSEF 1941]
MADSYVGGVQIKQFTEVKEEDDAPPTFVFEQQLQAESVSALELDMYTAGKSISWGFGPVNVSGALDTSTWEASLEVSVLGISIGKASGSLIKGITLRISLFVASGEITFWKKGSEFWIKVTLSGLGKSWNFEKKIF